MTAAAADRNAGRKEGELVLGGIAASTTIYKGTLVGYDASGNLTPMTDSSGNTYAGVAYESGVGTTVAGVTKIRVERKGAFEFVLANAAITHLGDELYATDNQTLATSGTTKVGRAVEYLNSGKIYIDIGGYC